MFSLTIYVEMLTQNQFYRPQISRVLGWISGALLAFGCIWVPWQEFSDRAQFTLMGNLWLGFWLVVIMTQNDALRRAAIHQEHYESLRAGIEKIEP